jgi:hypothetical protein
VNDKSIRADATADGAGEVAGDVDLRAEPRRREMVEQGRMPIALVRVEDLRARARRAPPPIRRAVEGDRVVEIEGRFRRSSLPDALRGSSSTEMTLRGRANGGRRS